MSNMLPDINVIKNRLNQSSTAVRYFVFRFKVWSWYWWSVIIKNIDAR